MPEVQFRMGQGMLKDSNVSARLLESSTLSCTELAALHISLEIQIERRSHAAVRDISGPLPVA